MKCTDINCGVRSSGRWVEAESRTRPGMIVTYCRECKRLIGYRPKPGSEESNGTEDQSVVSGSMPTS